MCRVKLTPLWVNFQSIISWTKCTLCSMHKDSPVTEIPNTLTTFPFPFFWDQVFASQMKAKEEICLVKLTLFVDHQLLILYLLYKVHFLFHTLRQPSGQNTQHTCCIFFSFSFFGTKSLHHRLRLRMRCVEWNWHLCGSTLSQSSLVQIPLSIQHIKTVQWPKYSTHSLHFLFQVFASQIKTKQLICWVISSLSPIFCAISTLCLVHGDSLAAKTAFPILFFHLNKLCITD